MLFHRFSTIVHIAASISQKDKLKNESDNYLQVAKDMQSGTQAVTHETFVKSPDGSSVASNSYSENFRNNIKTLCKTLYSADETSELHANDNTVAAAIQRDFPSFSEKSKSTMMSLVQNPDKKREVIKRSSFYAKHGELTLEQKRDSSTNIAENKKPIPQKNENEQEMAYF